jgi:hypothetical protein
MIGRLLKFAVVAAVAYATWHLFSAYSTHYKLIDEVEYLVQYRHGMSDDEIRERIMATVAQLDLPVREDAVTIKYVQSEKHSIVDTAYTRRIELFPGVTREWPFTLHVDAFERPDADPRRP